MLEIYYLTENVQKSALIIVWKNVANCKCAILIGHQPGVHPHLSCKTKQKGNRVARKKANSSKNTSHKPVRKASRLIVGDQ